MLVMVIVASLGYLVNYFVKAVRSDVVVRGFLAYN
jgi:hypothetical protein